MKKIIKKLIIILIWILIWQLLSMLINNRIYFVGPVDTAKELFVQMPNPVFLLSAAASVGRILTGFLLAVLLGCVLSFISYKSGLFEEFLAPVTTLMKSVPIAAVVVILLIWWGSKGLTLSICFMVIFPNIYGSMLTGLKETDKKLLEMAEIFKIRGLNKLFYIYRPSYRPHLSQALKLSLGMGFKSGIAAEVIGLPALSIGERIYHEKISLNTSGVFAWIVVILFLSAVTERILMMLIKLLNKYPSVFFKSDLSAMTEHTPDFYAEAQPTHELIADNIKKSYEDRLLLCGSYHIKPNERYLLSAPSGSGKTTLLHVLAGLTAPDKGTVSGSMRIGMVFQEDRLIEEADVMTNLLIAGIDEKTASIVSQILPPDVISGRSVSTLSGGERRRVAVARAVLSKNDAVFLDEPFTGLDEENKKMMTDWISRYIGDRALILVSHDPADADALGIVNELRGK